MPSTDSKRATLRRQNAQHNLFKNVNAGLKNAAQTYYGLLEKVARLQENAQRGLAGASKGEMKAVVKELNKAQAAMEKAYRNTSRGNMGGGDPRNPRTPRATYSPRKTRKARR
jgi:hypothetical protein